MTHISQRYTRLINKNLELEKLFEQAASRRKKLLDQNKVNEEKVNIVNEKLDDKSYILKPLRTSNNCYKADSNDNRIEITSQCMCKNLQRNTSYYSQQNLTESNIDNEIGSLRKSNTSSNNNNYNNEDNESSAENISKSGHHNPNFVTYSSSSDDIDICNYCQFIPATSLSTNNTTSSHFSRTDNSTGKSSSAEQKLPDANSHFNRNSYEQSSVMFYPSGSPLISPKYQGSPVVRIDNKLRAGEADYLINRNKPSLGKPPVIPRRLKQPPKAHIGSVTTETRLSHPTLSDDKDYVRIVPQNPGEFPTSIIRRTKKKLLEEHMKKRFSVGDYSTRSLIEWENNLNSSNVLQLSLSGELPTETEKRKLSSQSEGIFPQSPNLEIISTAHNFSSEINILHCSSTDSFRDTQVSFSLKNDKSNDDKTPSVRCSKHSNFIRRSMNDIATALRNVTSSEKVHGPKRFTFSSRSHFMSHSIFKKRDSSSSDLLYSVPPFARKHLPPDISGAARTLPRDILYQGAHLPSSSPNLIAELDPTFHERYPPPGDDPPAPPQHALSKRNRSYRLSFIENAHTVTTKKLTATSVTTSPSSAVANSTVMRFVQPRRRMGAPRHFGPLGNGNSSHSNSGNCRSRSNGRFSCTQQ